MARMKYPHHYYFNKVSSKSSPKSSPKVSPKVSPKASHITRDEMVGLTTEELFTKLSKK
jgi:hypothetical protein